MIELQVRRNSFRQNIRKEQLQRKRQIVREVLLKIKQVAEDQCYLCLNEWLLKQEKPYSAQLGISVFKSKHVCARHIEGLFSRMLEIVFDCPPIFASVFGQNSQEKCSFFIRRVILLHEIMDNQLISSNKELQAQIITFFAFKGSFISSLFNQAFGISRWFDSGVLFAESRELKSSLRWITVSAVMLFYRKYPLLIVDFMEDYSLAQLWREGSQERKKEVFGIIANVYNQSRNRQEYFIALRHLETSIAEIIEGYCDQKIKTDLSKDQSNFVMLLEYITNLQVFISLVALNSIITYIYSHLHLIYANTVKSIALSVQNRCPGKDINEMSILTTSERILSMLEEASGQMDVQIG